MFNFGKKTKTILTHDGDPHQDEILGVCILQIYLEKQGLGCKVIRTRDPARDKDADYVLDVYRKYDGVKYFDHHQRGGAGVRPMSGIPYATAGLVWKHFGKEIVSSDLVFNVVDKCLLASADGQDNGISNSFVIGEKQLLGSYPTSIGHRMHIFMVSRYSFDELVKDFYRPFLESFIQKIEKNVETIKGYDRDAKHIFFDSIDTKLDDFILYEYFPNILYYTYRTKTDKFNTYAVSALEKSQFRAKKPFPENWWGLSGKDLEQVSGIKDAQFCHNSGNLIVVTGTREAADKVVERSLQYEN